MRRRRRDASYWRRASRPISIASSASLPAERGDRGRVSHRQGRRGRRDDREGVETFGRVDGVVNNAATNPYFGPLDRHARRGDRQDDRGQRARLSLRARARSSSTRARAAAAARSSTSRASPGMRAAPMQGIYGATKAAVISMTQTLAFELGSSKIRVNAIAPGPRRDEVRVGDRRQPDAARSRRQSHAARAPRAARGDRRRGDVLAVGCVVVHDRLAWSSSTAASPRPRYRAVSAR